ncbi:KICSTOR complex protein ITFG2-like [Chrysoperla carnea]|uniref:KICSTOR complex protein ITFG2-like n=1 Tax=Chrysoperla carnea TaxID=189513 RepID=UPI001D07285C|nr:KICSTOR complex protein ITFG2-like [Chrysoperla carnea]
MRSVCFVKRLEFDFACGTGVSRDAMTIGDVDNDGRNELIVGNTSGDLVLFKEKEQWQKITGLGMITCVGIGDILNCGCNALVVVGGDGWCRIFYCPSMIPSKEDENSSSEHHRVTPPQLECIHIQRIPANSKVVLLGDIDGDGLIEMVIALTDRVVRSYRWYESDQLSSSAEPKQSSVNENFKSGKLVCLNKWESSNQIGAVTLQQNPDGIPALLVAQPGGTFMRIRCNHENNMPEHNLDSASMTSENLTAPGVDYQFLGISQMRNQSVSTEVLADLNPKNPMDLNKIKPYAVATLDGTIMLVREEVIIWAIQVDHQIFALEKLDITGDGSEDIVACSWDGQTYMLDQDKNSVRFQLDEPVQAFCSGYYNVESANSKGSASLVYVTFKNKNNK